MSALIEVSNLNYNTDTGTISFANIKIGSQWFRVDFKDHKYIVNNIGETLGKSDENIKEPDKKPVVDVKAKPEVTAVEKTNPKTRTRTKPKVDNTKATADSKSFKDNDELIDILRQKENGFRRRVLRDSRNYEGIHRLGFYDWGPDRESDNKIVDESNRGFGLNSVDNSKMSLNNYDVPRYSGSHVSGQKTDAKNSGDRREFFFVSPSANDHPYY